MDIGLPYWIIALTALAGVTVRFIWFEIFFKKKLTTILGHPRAHTIKNLEVSTSTAYIFEFAVLFIVAFLGTFPALMVDVLFTGKSFVMAGILIALLVWPITLTFGHTDVVDRKKPKSLWYIEISSYLATLVVMGATMGALIEFWLRDVIIP